MVFVGVHPSLMHVPPTCSRSTSAVFQPARANAPANGPPAWPAPIIMASYCREVPIVQLVYPSVGGRITTCPITPNAGSMVKLAGRMYVRTYSEKTPALVFTEMDRPVTIRFRTHGVTIAKSYVRHMAAGTNKPKRL